jgi:hypothetical protein
MRRQNIDVETVKALIADRTISFGIPAYNDGDGVVTTLASLWEGITSLRINAGRLILSESYDQPLLSSAPAATAWARTVEANLTIDSCSRRRSLKEALNNIFENARSDVLIIAVSDVLVPKESLVAILHGLFTPPCPVVAIGATLPDPTFSALKYRAGAWQLRAVTRAARLAPRWPTQRSSRAEGAFWGVWRPFYSTYRLPIGSGSIHDDVELSRELALRGYSYLSAPEASVYKVPPASFVDLCSGTVRSQVAAPEHRRSILEFAAGLAEAVRDPLGAMLYVLARIWCSRHHKRFVVDSTEHWRVSNTTKRQQG